MIRVMNAGNSGDTTRQGLDRLERSVLSHRPDVVTISFGLNNVVRVSPDEFRQNLVALVERCRHAKAGVVLCTPNRVVPTVARPLDKLSAYYATIREVGRTTDVCVCDQFAAGEAWAAQDVTAWRHSLSDEIHPNLIGHQQMAETLCYTLSGRRVALGEIPPPRPALRRTWQRIAAREPVHILAMPPWDQWITTALQQHAPHAQLAVTSWPTAGQSLLEIERFAAKTVRAAKPDLVLIAVPRSAAAPTDEAFVRHYTGILNHALSFGQQAWDCVVAHPNWLEAATNDPRDALVRSVVRGQHLHLLDRAAVNRTTPHQILAQFVIHDALEAVTPIYADKHKLKFFYDEHGALQPVRTVADWQIRAKHLLGNMQRVMGPLPPRSQLPLDMQIHSETRLAKYTRQLVSFVAETDDRAYGYLLLPHNASGRRPAMICLPGSSAPGKDAPAALGSNPDMAYGHELAERGYVCLVLDYPLLHTREYKTDPYALGYASATLKGVVNHRRGVDLLCQRDDVDAQRIGVVGHSLGGHNALFLAAFDDRVRVIASSCGFNVFAKHNHGNVAAWSSRYYMPRIKTIYGDDPAQIPFDFTELLAALAPRPVFVNAPLHDEPDFEVSGVRDCIAAAEPIYRELFDAADKLHVEYPDAGHTFPVAQRTAFYRFLDEHLRGPKTP